MADSVDFTRTIEIVIARVLGRSVLVPEGCIDITDDDDAEQEIRAVETIIDLTADSPQQVDDRETSVGQPSVRRSRAGRRSLPSTTPSQSSRITRARNLADIREVDEAIVSNNVPQQSTAGDSINDVITSVSSQGNAVAAALGIPSPKRPRNGQGSTSDASKKACVQLMCPICLEEFLTVKTGLVSTPCGHIFCKGCVDEVLKEKNAICPTCRKKLTKKSIHPIYL